MFSNKIKSILLIVRLLAVATLLVSCGVKGDPVPPATPAEIGSGRPLSRTRYEGGPATALPVPSSSPDIFDRNEDDEEEQQQ